MGRSLQSVRVCISWQKVDLLIAVPCTVQDLLWQLRESRALTVMVLQRTSTRYGRNWSEVPFTSGKGRHVLYETAPFSLHL